MTIKVPYSWGEIVYLNTDEDQSPYEIVGIISRPGATLVELSKAGEIIEVYDFQVSKTKNELKTFGIDKDN